MSQENKAVMANFKFLDFPGIWQHFAMPIKQLTEDKISKLVKFVEEPVEIHVILETEKRRQIAEFHVSHRHGVLQATEESEHMREAIQAGIDKLEKQARRARKKFMDKRRRGRRQDDNHWPLDVLEAASVAGGLKPRVIKTTRLPIKPMTIDEAALELDGSKNDFFVFRDSGTDRVSVIYRRKDANYGLIAPDF